MALNIPLLAASHASDTPYIGNVPDVPVAPSFLLRAAGEMARWKQRKR